MHFSMDKPSLIQIQPASYFQTAKISEHTKRASKLPITIVASFSET